MKFATVKWAKNINKIHKAKLTEKQMQKEVNTNWNGLLFLSIKLGENGKSMLVG